MAGTKICVAVACLVALLQISSSLATSYTVGDTGGWTANGDYSTWASGKTFAAGDTLVFNFLSQQHTVSEVSKSDYDSCATGNEISSKDTSPVTVTLTAGTHYYICNVHCGSGQKLTVTVGSSSSSPSTPSSPSPSSSTTPSTTPTTPSTTSSPPPPSSAVVAGAGLVMPFFMGAAAFLI